MIKTIVLALILAIAFVLAWHLFFPILGGVIAITATAWHLLILAVVMFCVATLLVFIFTGLGVFILGGILFVATLLAIILFPIMFPILVPLLIIFFVVSHFVRKKKKSQEGQISNRGP